MPKKRVTDEQKQIMKIAREDWNEQCKRFMQGQPFRDKTARKCFERHWRERNERANGNYSSHLNS